MEYAHYLPRDLVVSFLGLVFVSVVMRSLLMWQRRTRGKLLPPGPRHLPILGYLNAPKFKPWFAFKEMSTRYGSDILYFRRFGQHNIVLSDPSVITEYLVKRTTNTSDRVHSPSVTLSTLNRRLAFMPYAAEWSDCRRATFAATILKITYGIDIDDENAEIVQVVENAGKGPGQTLIPGRFLVDSIPFLRFVPAWMPGAGFQRQFAEWGAASRKLKDFPYVRRNTAFTDNALPSCATIADTLLSEKGETGEYSSGIGQEDLVKTVCGAAYVACNHQTYSTLQAAFLALSLYPDVQRKAQAELFAVVGPDRLPDFGDREALVYVNALVKEMLRWFNVTPLGMAHRTMADDELNGYFIPAGTMITPNIWACMHDPAEYEDADEFRPERFIRDGKLDSTVRDPLAFAFGFGKRHGPPGDRICPGRYFADTALFINVASVLHVFDITPPLDENGNPIRVKMEMSDGFISYPEDCRCTIRPRSEKAAALILKTQG
ncbi:O-methylsterigmatocystin oxidoreductase [Dichomitus squalens]|uniref:O-methylsterigmatocystin oxidoreductase n=1 Tax=Dichomitus squalens TaxID=114155 RepID=A0A4Q9NV66_9APHY|nr:O-methylsterigmatocystin oxidoreductase [Dichomitus squalens]TBU54463.1 O-methylsterigmatocystin oxidoreductase [Dichomitus squalens]